MEQQLRQQFATSFGRQPKYLFSAPGRTELSGNHTDHQHGLVLAAAVDRQMLAAVGENGSNTVRILSRGYDLCTVELDQLQPRQEEQGTTAALVRGVLSRFADYDLRGFDAYIVSQVPAGSGLSSSAAFEVLLGAICNQLAGEPLDGIAIARIGQYGENVYFGKPSGLMDQMACALGGVLAIDFADPAEPAVERLDIDFTDAGYCLCIIHCGGSHAAMTDEYAAITRELQAVCREFGQQALRHVPEADFYARLPRLRQVAGDRAVCRAMHIYEENKRVARQVKALREKDMDSFLAAVRESGSSSWRLLQNVTPAGADRQQELAVALALAEKLLKGQGACRVHGGGFAGTVQAFVPMDCVDSFTAGMDKVLGQGSCQVMRIRRRGAVLEQVYR